MSLRLQTLCLAIFDAILVHMLIKLSPEGKWLHLKRQILDALLHQKEQKALAILKGPYAGTDVLFVQEVRTAAARTTLPAALTDSYFVLAPIKPSKANQNSVIALAKARVRVHVRARAFDARSPSPLAASRTARGGGRARPTPRARARAILRFSTC